MCEFVYFPARVDSHVHIFSVNVYADMITGGRKRGCDSVELCMTECVCGAIFEVKLCPCVCVCSRCRAEIVQEAG